MKTRRFCLFVLSMLLLLSSCNKKEKSIQMYNNYTNSFSESRDYIIINIDEGYLYDKNTMQVIPLEIDPIERFDTEEAFDQLTTSIKKCIFTTTSKVYILTPIADDWNTSSDFKIEVIDLDSLSKTTLYQTSNPSMENDFLGLKKLFDSENTYDFEMDGDILELTNSWGIFHFLVYDNLIFTVENNSIYTYNWKNGETNKITEERIKGESLSCDGKNIYYLTITNDLFCYNISTQTTVKFLNDKISEFYIFDNCLYYENISDNGYLYRLNISTLQREKISEKNYDSWQVDNGYIYYIEPESNFLYRLSLNNNHSAPIIEQQINEYIVSSQCDKIFYSTEEEVKTLEQISTTQKTAIYMSDKNGENKQKILLE